MRRLALATLSVLALGTVATTAANGIKPIDMNALIHPTASASSLTTPTQLAAAQTAGEFVTVEQDHATTGTASIVTEGDQRYLVFDDAFDTARGPDVQVVLYTGSTVPVNLEEGDYVTLAPLQSFEGTQRYLIPDDIDLEDYQAVGIWCRQFNVTFGYAPL
ncbi:hypothetical protein XM38_026490 [Halomicronema hongdechloris C2206]|uniref:DM13 domain-containing protein n=1 Tax=Halomicronema hongdechloris C2206 TaxID=1641165 RepID=A0A1V8NDU1_9CYAN|nr:DM13 domain-containing protein [Halomicronema hongdechloris]ASC71695.1 hypothetical protein XM38_026490 [Halomicronema hongdechloris C2206]